MLKSFNNRILGAGSRDDRSTAHNLGLPQHLIESSTICYDGTNARPREVEAMTSLAAEVVSHISRRLRNEVPTTTNDQFFVYLLGKMRAAPQLFIVSPESS